jgi:hypothetical protein
VTTLDATDLSRVHGGAPVWINRLVHLFTPHPPLIGHDNPLRWLDARIDGKPSRYFTGGRFRDLDAASAK